MNQSFRMKALFAYHRDPLCNTEDNYFMKSLVYRGICILCVASGCGGSGYFNSYFPFIYSQLLGSWWKFSQICRHIWSLRQRKVYWCELAAGRTVGLSQESICASTIKEMPFLLTHLSSIMFQGTLLPLQLMLCTASWGLFYFRLLVFGIEEYVHVQKLLRIIIRTSAIVLGRAVSSDYADRWIMCTWVVLSCLTGDVISREGFCSASIWATSVPPFPCTR